jgi:predicted oxidoreductase
MERGKRRGPSQVRNMLETRVRRISSTYSRDEQRAAAKEIRDIADDFLEQTAPPGQIRPEEIQ